MGVTVGFLLGVEAHVKLFYSDNEVNLEGRPIRNAPAAASDGRMSTSGPCGTGDAVWGSNGYSFVEKGQDIQIKINYNGGHKSANNLFRGKFSCGADETPFTQASLAGNSEDLIPVMCTSVRCPTNSYPCGAAIGNDFTEGYVFSCTVPDEAAGRNCSLAIVDQRDWGGCYDLFVRPEPVNPGNGNGGELPAPNASPTMAPIGTVDPSIIGTYYDVNGNGMVSNAPVGSTCCTIQYGKFYVSESDIVGMQVMSELMGECEFSGEVWDLNHKSMVPLVRDIMGPVWRAQLMIGPDGNKQSYELSISDGNLQISQDDPAVPSFCDLSVALRENSASRSALSFVVVVVSVLTGLMLL